MASDRTYSATDWANITPSDSAFVEGTPVALYVGGAGDIAIESKDGSVVTLVGVQTGTYMYVQPVKVLATNTTATNLIALYN